MRQPDLEWFLWTNIPLFFTAILWPLLYFRSRRHLRQNTRFAHLKLTSRTRGDQWTIPIYFWGVANTVYLMKLLHAICACDGVIGPRRFKLARLEIGGFESVATLAIIFVLILTISLAARFRGFSRSQLRLTLPPTARLVIVTVMGLWFATAWAVGRGWTS